MKRGFTPFDDVNDNKDLIQILAEVFVISFWYVLLPLLIILKGALPILNYLLEVGKEIYNSSQ